MEIEKEQILEKLVNLKSSELEKLEKTLFEKLKRLKERLKYEMDAIPRPKKRPSIGIKEENGIISYMSKKELKDFEDMLKEMNEDRSKEEGAINNCETIDWVGIAEDFETKMRKFEEPHIQKEREYEEKLKKISEKEDKEILDLIKKIANIKWILKERKEKKEIKKVKFNILGDSIQLEK